MEASRIDAYVSPIRCLSHLRMTMMCARSASVVRDYEFHEQLWEFLGIEP
jgi:hypothetical protein